MTPISYLKFFADLYDVDPDVAEERMHDTLDELELEHRDRKLGDMSKGMKRKVAIARSLINDPDVLIYDEPASGLDPLTTNYVIEFTEQLAKEGKTIVFSAHNLFHVESICDRVVIMNEGEIVARGDLEQLQAEYGHTRYHVYTTVDVPGAAKENGTYERVVESMEQSRRHAGRPRTGAATWSTYGRRSPVWRRCSSTSPRPGPAARGTSRRTRSRCNPTSSCASRSGR